VADDTVVAIDGGDLLGGFGIVGDETVLGVLVL